MRYLLTREQMASCDAFTINKIGIPSLVLMERAALSVYDVIKNKYPNAGNILVLCGCGNNGGDGFAVARLLLEAGRNAVVLFIGKHDRMTAETKKQAEIFCRLGGVILPDESSVNGYDLIVDALFGIGLSRTVIGKFADVINAVNFSDTPVVAVDIPSGVDSDSGCILGTAIRADVTVSIQFEKLGMALYPGAEYCGEIIVRRIGISDAALRLRPVTPSADSAAYQDTHEPVYTFDKKDLTLLLPERIPTANKGTYGKLLLIGGNENMAGAVVMAGKAACRTGCGLVCVCSHENNRLIVQTSLPEALYAPWDSGISHWLEWADAVAIGPGLGQTDQSRRLLTELLQKRKCPIVLDADALNLIAAGQLFSSDRLRAEGTGNDIMHRQSNAIDNIMTDNGITQHLYPQPIITPHPGEMARLVQADQTGSECEESEKATSGISSSDHTGTGIAATGNAIGKILTSPIDAARSYANMHGCITVLKGARTVVTNGEETMLNLTGNDGMATGGSGDVLTGIIGSLLAQGMEPFEAAETGVLLHGLTGDAAAEAAGSRSLIAGDLPDFLPDVLREL